jgi:hypothetical protein
LLVPFVTDNFRPYLEHAEFIMETDSQALWWLIFSSSIKKTGRWVVTISSLKFKVQHVGGAENVVTHALSRPTFRQLQRRAASLAFCDLAMLQREDLELRRSSKG